MAMLAPRPVLSLEDLEAHDPRAAAGGRERRFLCPLPACGEHGIGRSLSLNVESGAWTCYRCQASGQLRERWQPPLPRHQRAAAALRRAFGDPAAHYAARNVSAVETPALPPAPAPTTWRPMWDASVPLAGTRAAAYLAGRGIPLELAAAAGVRYAAAWYGRPAVVFPLRARSGELVAAEGRHLDDGTPKAHGAGAKKLGVFHTPAPARPALLAIAEAPIDALSLAAAGVPALALCGTSLPDWIPAAVAFRDVALATDADAAGDRAADRLAPLLGTFGARVRRWRPAAKDWNDVLRAVGADALRQALAERIPAPRAPAAALPLFAPQAPAPAPGGSPATATYTRCRHCGGHLPGHLEWYGWCRECSAKGLDLTTEPC